MKKLRVYIFLVCLAFVSSCSIFGGTEVSEFVVDTRLNGINGNLLSVDLSDAIFEGIVVPTVKQTEKGMFDFSFKIRKSESEKLYYKIYYQNESYKYDEKVNERYNPLASENFYGSWEDTQIGFKEFSEKETEKVIYDSFRIVGNPRNEKKYFGKSPEESIISEVAITQTVNNIKSIKEWYNAIKEKAVKLNNSIERQLRFDAMWVLKNERNKGDKNNRWKRNLRMGSYSAMLVVTNEEDYKKLPPSIIDINKPDSADVYMNPYYYFLSGAGSKLKETKIIKIDDFIKLKASLNTSKLFIDQSDIPNVESNKYRNATCGNDSVNYRYAHFQQFFSAENKDFVLKTIPKIADVTNNEYTLSDYEEALKKYKDNALTVDYIRNTKCPCKTVAADETGIQITTPGNNSVKGATKENVGVKTRIGVTYGKITAKVKMPSLINKTNVWNGLTNAIWLLYQDNAEWNNRRYSPKGYLPRGAPLDEKSKEHVNPYSEIDFEIVKATKYWPANYYNRKDAPVEDGTHNGNVLVALTNWDLSNRDAKNYFTGIDTIPSKGGAGYEALRWFEFYQALTIRHGESNDEMFNRPYYYFQIEWKPGEITWRIGPEKNKMKEIGYMNDDVTSVPNNQMIMVFTQEYHLSSWWPPIPFLQEYVPFPAKDINGKIYEVEIE